MLRTPPGGNSGVFRTPPPLEKPLSLIEHSQNGQQTARRNSEDRTREDVGQVAGSSYHENGDINDIRRDDMLATAITIIPPLNGNDCPLVSIIPNHRAVPGTPPSKSQARQKKGGALLSCFSQSKRSIFIFKSPKKDKVVMHADAYNPHHHHLQTQTTNARMNVPRLKKLASVDSANTISNSSLQEIDDEEFNSSDLIKYMEEINQGIKC